MYPVGLILPYSPEAALVKTVVTQLRPLAFQHQPYNHFSITIWAIASIVIVDI
jgi:hypothetical protein